MIHLDIPGRICLLVVKTLNDKSLINLISWKEYNFKKDLAEKDNEINPLKEELSKNRQ